MPSTTCLLSTKDLYFLSELKSKMLLAGYTDVQSGGLVSFILDNGLPLLKGSEEPVGRGSYSSVADSGPIVGKYGFTLDPRLKTIPASSFLELSEPDRQEFLKAAKVWLDAEGKELCKYVLSFYIPASFDKANVHLGCSQAIRVILRDHARHLLNLLETEDRNEIDALVTDSGIQHPSDFLSISLSTTPLIEMGRLIDSVTRYRPAQAKSYFLAMLDKHEALIDYVVTYGFLSPYTSSFLNSEPKGKIPYIKPSFSVSILALSSYRLRQTILCNLKSEELLFNDLHRHHLLTFKVDKDGKKMIDEHRRDQAARVFLTGYIDTPPSALSKTAGSYHLDTDTQDWINFVIEHAKGLCGSADMPLITWLIGLLERHRDQITPQRKAKTDILSL